MLLSTHNNQVPLPEKESGIFKSGHCIECHVWSTFVLHELREQRSWQPGAPAEPRKVRPSDWT